MKNISAKKAIDVFFRSLDAQCLDDPEFVKIEGSKADFILHDHKVVVETKILEKDVVGIHKENPKYTRLIKDLAKEGIIQSQGLVRISSDKLPEPYKKRFTNIVVGPMRGDVKKAGRQIKSTKEIFRLEDYKGLLLIVNEGDSGQDLSNVQSAMQIALGNDHSNISEVVFTSCNVYYYQAGYLEKFLPWINFNRPDITPPLGDQIIDKLHDYWIACLSTLKDTPIKSRGKLPSSEIGKIKSLALKNLIERRSNKTRESTQSVTRPD